jgi:8-oxo-dGTP diphosphatase
MTLIIVVAAVIVNPDKKILIAKRKKGKFLENLWEFPGGKVEKDENEENCLRREMLEEFGIDVQIIKYLTNSKYKYDKFEINLKAYLTHHKSGIFKLRDHSEIKWIKIADYKNYNFAPADIPINKYLIKYGY